MYYADEPRKERTRLPMSKEIRTLGLISGIALPFLFLLSLLPATWLPLTHTLFVADVAVLAICTINPATPKRKVACKIIAVIAAVLIVGVLISWLLAYLGVAPYFIYRSPVMYG